MRFYLAIGIFLLTGCSQLPTKGCSTSVLGTWESTIPAADDSGKVRAMPEMDLLISYKPNGTFVSSMRQPADQKDRSMVATGSWTCTQDALTLSIYKINGQPPKDPIHNVMVTAYELRNVRPDSFDNYWREEDTTLHFRRSSESQADRASKAAP
jgi:hypothetical protein